MNKKKTGFLAVMALASVIAVGTISLASSNASPATLFGARAGDTEYGFTLNAGNAAHVDGEVVATESGNPIALAFSGASASDGAFCALSAGGSISNTREVKAITKVTIVATGTVRLYAGSHQGAHWAVIEEVASGTPITLAEDASYFKIEAVTDAVITSVSAAYRCLDVTPSAATHTPGDLYHVVETEDQVTLTKKCTDCGEACGTSYPHAKVTLADGDLALKASGASYGYKLSGGWYTSQNYSCNSSKAIASFTVTKAGKLSISWEVSSEASYDKAYIKVDGSAHANCNGVSGTKTGSLELDVTVGQVITFHYEKDSSGDSYSDNFKFQIATGASVYSALTLNSNGGNELEPVLVNNGKVASLPEPTKSGYKFMGWYADSSFNDAVNADTNFGTTDKMIYAKWFDLSQACPLEGSYKGFYFYPYSSTTSNYGSTSKISIDATGEITNVSSGFSGETISSYSTLTGLGDTSTYNVYKNFDNGAVVFVPKSGAFSYSNKVYVYFKDVADTTSTSASGYDINLDDSAGHYTYFIFKNPLNTSENLRMVFNSTTRTASWDYAINTMDGKAMTAVASVKSNYGIEFASDDDTIRIASDGSKVQFADSKWGAYTNSADATQKLYLNGMSVAKEGTDLSSGTKYNYIAGETSNEVVVLGDTVSTSYTLTGRKYAKAEKTATVSFNMNGHGEQVADSTYPWGKKVAPSALPTPETVSGWAFTGWYTDAACEHAYVEGEIKADVTLYAGWSGAHTLTLVNNNGEANTVSSVADGATPTIADPVWASHIFKGWFTDEGLTEAYVPGAMSGDLTLYAKWEELPGWVGQYYGYNAYGTGNKNTSSFGSDMKIAANGTLSGSRWYSDSVDLSSYDAATGNVATNGGKQFRLVKASDNSWWALGGYNLSSTAFGSQDMMIYKMADSSISLDCQYFSWQDAKTSGYYKLMIITIGSKTYNWYIDCSSGTALIDVTFETVGGDALTSMPQIASGSSIVSNTLVVKNSSGTVVASFGKSTSTKYAALDGYQGTYNGTIGGETSSIVFDGAGTATVTVGSADAVTGTYSANGGVFTVTYGGNVISVSVDAAAHTFAVTTDGYEGTYIGDNGALVLDGYGACTLAGVAGTYTLSGGVASVTIAGETTTYILDKVAGTYELKTYFAGKKYSISSARLVQFNDVATIAGRLYMGAGVWYVDFTGVYDAATRTMTLTTTAASIGSDYVGQTVIFSVAEDKQSMTFVSKSWSSTTYDTYLAGTYDLAA